MFGAAGSKSSRRAHIVCIDRYMEFASSMIAGSFPLLVLARMGREVDHVLKGSLKRLHSRYLDLVAQGLAGRWTAIVRDLVLVLMRREVGANDKRREC